MQSSLTTNQLKLIAYLFVAILLLIFLSFTYFGVTNKIPISPDYNIPIAKSVLAGDWLRVAPHSVFLYYPRSSHFLLALFLFLGYPNLFGLLSWLILVVACRKLGDVFGLSKYMSFIFAAGFCTTITIIRTVNDQSIDKLLCAWFILCIIILEKPRKELRWSIFLGFAMGMLVGTKYSGPLFFLALLPVYGKTLFQYLRSLRFISWSLSFIVFGFIWYLRNFVVTGNPYYPANLLFFKGRPGFTQQDWMLWRIPVSYPQGLFPLANAFLSEFMVWSFTILVVIGYLIYTRIKKKTLHTKILRLAFLGLTTSVASLFLPITPAYKIELYHIVSDMRYILIPVVVFTLGTFLLADRYKKSILLAFIALVNAMPLFSFVPYQPKLFIFGIVIIVFLYFYQAKLREYCNFLSYIAKIKGHRKNSLAKRYQN